jgi:hypothetical protein
MIAQLPTVLTGYSKETVRRAQVTVSASPNAGILEGGISAAEPLKAQKASDVF